MGSGFPRRSSPFGFFVTFVIAEVTDDICLSSAISFIIMVSIWKGSVPMEALFTLLLLYLSLPFIELGIIIALAVSRNHYKRLAESYRTAAARVPAPTAAPVPVSASVTGSASAPSTVSASVPAVSSASALAAVSTPAASSASALAAVSPPAVGSASASAAVSAPTPAPSPRLPKVSPSHQFQQGTIPFVIGVIFVILAGFIFATTTWSILPSFMKAVMVLLVTVLFYGASLAAVKKLSIVKTGKAFYILGTIFLFVSTMAFGYFGLFGPSMTPLGEDCPRLYLIGMVLTEAGLLFGLKLFEEKLYSAVCLAGITVTAALFLAALKLPPEGFSAGMALFGVLTLLGGRLMGGKEERVMARFRAVYPVYASVNLWLISLLVLVWTGFGVLSGIAALVVGGAHFLQGRNAKAEEPETIAFAIFLLTGFARLISPGVLDEWLYLVTVTMLLLTVLDTFGLFGESRGKGFLLVHIILGVCTMILLALSPVADWSFNVSSLICMGLFLADVTIAAWKQKTALLGTAHTVVLLLFFHYAVCYANAGMENGLFILILLMGALFGAGMKGWYPFRNRIGEIVESVLLFSYVVFLLLIRLMEGVWLAETPWLFVTAIASVLVLTAVVWGWGKINRAFTPLCLLALWPVIIPAAQLAEYTDPSAPGFRWFALGYLAAVGGWDLYVRKNEPDCVLQVGIIGLISSAFGFNPDGGNLPFFLLLSLYLFLKFRRMEEGKRRTGCFYLSGTAALLGLYTASLDFTDYVMLRMLWPAAALALGDLWCFMKERLEGGPDRMFGQYHLFSAVSGSFLYAAAALGFYGAFDLDIRCLAVLAIFFLWQYGKSWPMEQPWWHLLPSLVTLLIPGVLRANYGVGNDVIYTSVMVTLVFSTALTRKYRPVFERTGEHGFRIDWFHLLVILPVLVMCVSAPADAWRFVYMLLIAGYFLQFLDISGLRKPALTAAGITGCIAFWIQPFVTWPALIRPELLLIPAVCLIWCLPRIWGVSKFLEDIQTGLYLLCLGTLTANAFITSKPWDALILEGICLTVFFWSYYKKCGRWLRFSGGLAVGIVLYMTRGFWLSLAWWVYLLAAGVGLILFAAYNEMKKR